MSFIHHNYLGELELEKKETNGIRLYNLPDGQWVPCGVPARYDTRFRAN
jgi:hypothetical protein